jgi:hypothetical protein
MIVSFLSLILVLVLAIAYLLYCIRPAAGTNMAKVRHFALSQFPSKLGQFGDRLLGPWFSQTLTRVRNYLFFTNNPLVMYFYVVVVVGCYLLYIKKVFVEHAALIHTMDALAGNMTVFVTFYFFFKAVQTPATVVTATNAQSLVAKFQSYYDGTVFVEGATCQTCRVPKSTNQTRPIQTL